MNIESFELSFSEAREVSTRNGVRYVRTASPTPAFWSAWRFDKEAVKALGISVRKGDDAWEISWWSQTANVTEMPEAPAGKQGEADMGAVNTPSGNSDGTITPTSFAADSAVVWSDEQTAIFDWFARGTGSLVVQARAGTGKTTTIKQAFTHAPESTMLYAVFNKKNQREAEAKITDARVDVRTLHSLGFLYIKSVWPHVQPGDEVESQRIAEVEPGIPDEPAGCVERLVGFAKNTLLNATIADLEKLAEDRNIFSAMEDDKEDAWPVHRLASVAFAAMELAKEPHSSGHISFNDMVWLPVVNNWVKPRYDLVTVDEAQDMNLPQLEMAVRACKPGGRICVVGDDRQAIYGFRGAAQDGMEMMKRKLRAATLGLTTTYRCPKSVVAIAAEIVTDYKAAPSAPEGIVEEIEFGNLVTRLAVGDAVLSRLNAPLMSTCLQLLRNGVSARIEGRDIGKQLVGMVRKLRAKSVPDFLRKLYAWGDKQKSRISAGPKAEARMSLVTDQVETLAAVAEGCENIAAIEARLLSLFQDSDSGAKPAVVLSTVHKAKGLEWNRVFILSSTFKKSRGAEEANIFYVAVTRAKQQLTFVD
jgi:ATP-dependent DNA helicase UvrD/PcrA